MYVIATNYIYLRKSSKYFEEILLYAVHTEALRKTYSGAKAEALQACSFKVEQGRIFGLLGPNGAGKTTLIKMLLGIVKPSGGRGFLLGEPIDSVQIHGQVGYLAENHRFPGFLTASQILWYYGKMSGVAAANLTQRIPELLKMVKLDSWADTRIQKFSKGMAQRLGLAHALINDPQLIFLDEPTDGIDPVGRKEVRDLLVELRSRGKTIFLNSHLLSEVERVSDEIAILKKGRVLQSGPLQNFIAADHQYFVELKNGSGLLEAMCGSMQIEFSRVENRPLVTVQSEQQLNALIDALRKQKALISSIVPRKISLEDYFVDIISEDGNGGQI